MDKTKKDTNFEIDSNFIHEFIKKDIELGGKKIHTRFPPEPNGYLHIGHAKAICINFEIAKKFNGICNLRMDDTNPSQENTEYVNSIKKDILWLGFDWENNFYYASEYFDKMYELACNLIKNDLAYVCELSFDQVKKNRGNLINPAISPYRDRPIKESLTLFEKMKNGEFEDGKMTLRAKIDLSSGNFNMRDPIIYRINHAYHHRTKNKWCIYPMYDYAHPIEDSIEGITHSLCSLEFEDHRPLYDWVKNNINLKTKPRQIEFSRLNIDHTIMSKRKLRKLVEENIVDGWDDPRMPTISGIRRRGYTPESIKNFCKKIGVSKVISTVKYAFLEHCLREDLNKKATRVMGVLDPIKLIITNYPKDKVEKFEIENNPGYPESGKRMITFSRELFIEKNDFIENPPKKYFRLFPENEVRLKSTYIVKCTGCKKDSNGNVTEVYAEYNHNTKGGITPKGKKIKGTIHWVDTKTCINAQVRLYENLFLDENPDSSEKNFLESINHNSLKILKNCKVENFLKNAKSPSFYQFMRQGYFCVDNKDSSENNLIFNRSVSLKDNFNNQKSK